MKLKRILYTLVVLTFTSCSIPVDEAPPPTPLTTASSQPTLTTPVTFTATPSLNIIEATTQIQPLVFTQTPLPTQSPDFCADIRGYDLIASLIKAITSKDGALLASLVSPSYGVDVRYYRDGKVINYDVEHAKFIFETTFQANWGLAFGSGKATIGSFQEIILPALQQVFTPSSLIVCSQLQTGGATYFPEWPYPDLNYYSVYFPGTSDFGTLDWQTWAVGMDNIAGSPYLTALVRYVWEP